MADGFTIDDSELRTLAADLGRIPGRILPEVDKVLAKGALNLKGTMRAEFVKSRAFRQVGRTVSYDRLPGLGIGYEVGPTIGGAGSLAGIAVEGGARGGGGTVEVDHLLPAEATAVEKYLGDVLEDLL